MFSQGLGIDQNHKKANYYYRLAAEQGLPEAQAKMGLAYLDGDKTKDISLAYMWFALAASSNDKESKLYLKGVEYITKQMTVVQIAEAKIMIEACIIGNYKNCDRKNMKNIIAKAKEKKFLPEKHMPLANDPLNIRD